MFAAELDDFAEEADGLVGEGFEVGGGDAGGCFRHVEMVTGWDFVVGGRDNLQEIKSRKYANAEARDNVFAP